MLRGRIVKLLPTTQQEQLFWQFAGTRRFAYNWALSKQLIAFNNNEKLLTSSALCKEFVRLKHSDKNYNWLNSISCDVPKQAIKDLCDAYSKFFKKQKQSNYVKFTKSTIAKANRQHRKLTTYDMNGHPKFKKKLNCQESFHNDCMQLTFKDDKVNLAKIGWVKLSNPNAFPQGKSGKDFKIANAKIKTDGINWFLVGAIDTDIPQLSIPKSEPLGIDLGIKDTAILSDGTKFKNINKSKRVKKLLKTQRRLQRKISRKYKNNKCNNKYIKTKNIIKSEKQLLKLNHKLSNIHKNYCHQLTSEIVKRNPIFIVIEDLSVSGMMKNKHLSKSIQQQGFNYIRTYLTYKCEQYNIPLYVADRFYPSSKTCSHCGSVKTNLKLSDRIYKCSECGFTIDRDLNAAINLKNYGQAIYNKSID